MNGRILNPPLRKPRFTMFNSSNRADIESAPTQTIAQFLFPNNYRTNSINEQLTNKFCATKKMIDVAELRGIWYSFHWYTACFVGIVALRNLWNCGNCGIEGTVGIVALRESWELWEL